SGGVPRRHQCHAWAYRPPVRRAGDARLRLSGHARSHGARRVPLSGRKGRAALAAAGCRQVAGGAPPHPGWRTAGGVEGPGALIAAELLQPLSQWLGWLIYAALLAWAVWRTPWV